MPVGCNATNESRMQQCQSTQQSGRAEGNTLRPALLPRHPMPAPVSFIRQKYTQFAQNQRAPNETPYAEATRHGLAEGFAAFRFAAYPCRPVRAFAGRVWRQRICYTHNIIRMKSTATPANAAHQRGFRPVSLLLLCLRPTHSCASTTSASSCAKVSRASLSGFTHTR